MNAMSVVDEGWKIFNMKKWWGVFKNVLIQDLEEIRSFENILSKFCKQNLI